MPTITIRPLESLADFKAAEDLQAAVWPGSERDVVPLHLLTTVAHNGGLVLGAFVDGQLAGFLLGFLGTDESSSDRPAMARLKHCSHQLGILPGYRDQQLGYRLKLAQRDLVVRQGVRLITWTYDPLESRNARLNIAKLGAVCCTYKREVYGVMADGLNAGLPSDRFQVDWWVTSPRVKERLFGQRLPLMLESFLSAGSVILNPARPGPDGALRPAERPAAFASTTALVEVPADFQSIKLRDAGLALAWRLHARELFEALFERGYLVTDFFHETADGVERSYYALSLSEVRPETSDN